MTREPEGFSHLIVESVPGRDPSTIRTFVVHSLLAQGYFAANAIYASIAHTDDVLDHYLEALSGAMTTVAARSDEEPLASLPNGASRTGFGD